MAVNDIWRLSFLGSWAGSDVSIITMHIKFLTGVSTFAGAAAYLKANLIDLLATQQDDNFRWDQINGLTVNLTPPQSAEYTTGFPVVGSLAGDQMARQVAEVVTVKTSYAGRSYRGRNFIPAIGEGSITNGFFTVAQVAAVQTYYDDLVAALGLGGSNADYQWVVWSQKLNLATPVTSTIVRSNPGVIRRRRAGAGS